MRFSAHILQVIRWGETKKKLFEGGNINNEQFTAMVDTLGVIHVSMSKLACHDMDRQFAFD